MVPTHIATSWHMFIDHKKLNHVTRKGHFPLPFLNQILEELWVISFINSYSYSGYYQIDITSKDQEKTTFTYPYGTFTFQRMSFGLYHIPATFKSCVMSIFSNMVEDYLLVVMDSFSIFQDSFESCLTHLGAIFE